jgi:hypothetical protein
MPHQKRVPCQLTTSRFLVCRYELLAQVARELPGGAVSVLQDTLQDVLDVLPHILPAEGLRLAPPLCQVWFQVLQAPA